MYLFGVLAGGNVLCINGGEMFMATNRAQRQTSQLRPRWAKGVCVERLKRPNPRGHQGTFNVFNSMEMDYLTVARELRIRTFVRFD